MYEKIVVIFFIANIPILFFFANEEGHELCFGYRADSDAVVFRYKNNDGI